MSPAPPSARPIWAHYHASFGAVEYWRDRLRSRSGLVVQLRLGGPVPPLNDWDRPRLFVEGIALLAAGGIVGRRARSARIDAHTGPVEVQIRLPNETFYVIIELGSGNTLLDVFGPTGRYVGGDLDPWLRVRGAGRVTGGDIEHTGGVTWLKRSRETPT